MDDPADDRDLLETLVTLLAIFDIVVYSCVLLFDVYMVVKYLIMEKKHELTYLISFYSLTFALSISKICYFITVLRYTGDQVHQNYIMDLSSEFGVQLKVQIGLIQVAIMVELGIQVKLSARKLTPDEAVKKIRKVRTGLKLAAAFFLAVGIFDTINAIYNDPVIVPDPAKWHHIFYVTIFPC